ncbi:hypothetical protein PLESTM_001350000 [Pleodorina starrii]|nr:hypothetical protein PLESTM_001350000 [Pleodorina starrii]
MSLLGKGSRLSGLSHGLLYCIASLVLGIELNIVGPTVDSLAAQVGVNESALGGVVGLGGIGLLVGGLPAGWLLDRLPGHAVLAGALALQAFAFLLLPHCAHLAVLATTYCAAALTFNAITTGANALILWRYPSSQGAWLNLASALFGVGCFLAPVLADLASGATGPSQGQEGEGGGGTGGPFSLRGGPASMAYYAVAAGSPPRPDPHHHHHHPNPTPEADGGGGGGGSAPRSEVRLSADDQQRGKCTRLRVSGGANDRSTRNSGDGDSPDDLASSPSFASVLDLTGLESPTTSVSSQPLRAAADGAVAPTAAAAAGDSAGDGSGDAIWGTSSTTSPNDDDASPTAAPPLEAAPARLPPPPAALAPDGAAGGGGGRASGSGTDGGFGSALSTSPPTWDEAGAGAPDQCCRHGGGGGDGSNDNPVYGTAAAAAAAGGADGNAHADILSAAAAQIQLLQRQKKSSGPQKLPQRQGEATAPAGWWRRGGAQQLPANDPRVAEATIGGSGPHHPMVAATAAAPPPQTATAALFRRYLHELRMGWPVLLPVVLLLFANISTQASFGAWVTTYCQRAAGLDEGGAHAVTAAYWAAFTGTRMAAVAAAPFLHASRVLLITSPFAVAGAGMAVLGLPKIPWLFPAATAAATDSPAAAAAFAAGLPQWALYTAVCLVGVGVSTGFANTVSLTGDHLQLDGFTNGILSSVAGLASTLCPAAVPWLAEHTGMGYGALMAVALAMSGVQLAMVVAALVGARWVDEWQKAEEEAEEREEEREEEEERRRRGGLVVAEEGRGRKAGGGSRVRGRGGEGQGEGGAVVVVVGPEGEEEEEGKRGGGGGEDLRVPLLRGSRRRGD